VSRTPKDIPQTHQCSNTTSWESSAPGNPSKISTSFVLNLAGTGVPWPMITMRVCVIGERDKVCKHYDARHDWSAIGPEILVPWP
jgi:hypothetical protein